MSREFIETITQKRLNVYILCRGRSAARFRYNYAPLNCLRSMVLVLPSGTGRLLRVSLLPRICMMGESFAYGF